MHACRHAAQARSGLSRRRRWPLPLRRCGVLLALLLGLFSGLAGWATPTVPGRKGAAPVVAEREITGAQRRAGDGASAGDPNSLGVSSLKIPDLPIGSISPLTLRKVPGPSPEQTVGNFLRLTDQAETVIRRAVRQGLTEPGPFFSPAVLRAADGAVDTMLEATEALDLSQVPMALRPMTGVGTMLMLRSLLRYDLDHSPGLLIPDGATTRREHLQRWTIPETPISLNAISESVAHAGQACRRCSAGDFLFSTDTLAQVQEDFARVFGQDPELRRRYGADLFTYWALLPGGALPPKPFLKLPLVTRRFLLMPLAGQSLLQWLMLLPLTLVALGLLVWWLGHLRRWRQGRDAEDGIWPHLLRVVAVVPPLVLVSLWQSFAIDWINLIGPREAAVLVGSRVIKTLLQVLLIYLLAEAVGQLLTVSRQVDEDGTVQLIRRKGSGQILTVARTAGVLGVLALAIQTGQALGLTSLTMLAVSSVPALAISLGTQQLIRDIADGFSIWLDGQIRPGDRCTVGSNATGTQGRISSLGMRSVRLEQDDGTVLSIPNSQVASSVVANHRFRAGMPLRLSLALVDLQPPVVAARLETVRRMIAGHSELVDAKVQIESTDAGWRLTITGFWPVELLPADVRAAQERLMLELLTWETPEPKPG
jgi:MscS family membrane protein